MAFEYTSSSVGHLRAAADLSALQYRFVDENSSGLIFQVVTQGVDVLGVLQNKPLSGAPCTVWTVPYTTKVVAGAAVAQGAKVMSDTAGRAIAATATNKAVGKAITAAAAAGDIISVQLRDFGTQ